MRSQLPKPATCLAALLLAAAAVPRSVLAQSASPPPGPAEEVDKNGKSGHDLSFAVVPGPIYNPSLGWGLLVIPMAMYNVDPADTVSPGSTTIGFGMTTTNGSWAAGAGQKLYLAQDTWRLKGGAGYANVNQRFYGLGGEATGKFVNMTMQAVLATAEALRRVMPDGFAGLQLAYRQSRFLGKDAVADAALDAAGINRAWVRNLVPGLRFDYDSRDYQNAPRSGLLGEFTIKGASEALGSTNTYARVSTLYSQFLTLDAESRHVLAWSADVEGGFGDVPFDEFPDIGGNKALRGYIRGQFTDKNMLSTQVEWRWGYWKRLGTAAFAGVGKVFPAWTEFGSAAWLPSAGLGLRYQVIPARRMNARFDLAWGKEGPMFYFSVGEAF